MSTDLTKVKVSAYGTEYTVQEILDKLTKDEIKEVFEDILAGFLQEGRLEEKHSKATPEETIRCLKSVSAQLRGLQ